MAEAGGGDRIAEHYWRLHAQPAHAWEHEVTFTGEPAAQALPVLDFPGGGGDRAGHGRARCLDDRAVAGSQADWVQVAEPPSGQRSRLRFQVAVRVLDGKWTMLVIRDLLGGTRRFSELRASLAGISPKTLTDRLRDLEQHGLVERVSYAEIPPRVEYTLTKKGRTLEPVISALADWGRSADIEAGTVPGR